MNLGSSDVSLSLFLMQYFRYICLQQPSVNVKINFVNVTCSPICIGMEDVVITFLRQSTLNERLIHFNSVNKQSAIY